MFLFFRLIKPSDMSRNIKFKQNRTSKTKGKNEQRNHVSGTRKRRNDIFIFLPNFELFVEKRNRIIIGIVFKAP